MKYATIVLLSLAMLAPTHLHAQFFHNLELSGGWAHVSGNNGLDGFNVGAALWFTRRVSVAFDFDHVADTSQLSAFALTSAGLITTNNKMQDYLIGPRVFFHSKEVKVLHTLHPFAEVQFGASHLSNTLRQVGGISASATDNAGSWLLGGGGDVLLSPHWAGRINLGLLRTHFADSGQSRLRLSMGVAYTFGSRKVQ
jgi:hypothetical protein